MVTPRISSQPLTLEEADTLYRQHLEDRLDRERDAEGEDLDRTLDELFASCIIAVDRVV